MHTFPKQRRKPHVGKWSHKACDLLLYHHQKICLLNQISSNTGGFYLIRGVLSTFRFPRVILKMNDRDVIGIVASRMFCITLFCFAVVFICYNGGFICMALPKKKKTVCNY